MTLNQLLGIRVIEIPTSFVFAQVRFPRSKKTRIRKKWRNNKRNWKGRYVEQSYKADLGGEIVLLATPGIIDELKKQLPQSTDRAGTCNS